MKFIAAYLLAHLGASAAAAAGGEEEGDAAPAPVVVAPGKDDVRRILESIGAEVEEDRLDLLFAQLEGKGDVAELIAAGREKLAYAPCGAAGAPVAAGGAPAAAAGAAEAAKEEEKEEEMEESDGEGLGLSLFD